MSPQAILESAEIDVESSKIQAAAGGSGIGAPRVEREHPAFNDVVENGWRLSRGGSFASSKGTGISSGSMPCTVRSYDQPAVLHEPSVRMAAKTMMLNRRAHLGRTAEDLR